MKPTTDNKWLMLAVFIGICFGAAGIGGLVTSTTVNTWYVELNKPALMPPAGVFSPVWTVLYFLMALSAWLVWQKVGLRNPAWIYFLAQLALNVGWSIIFFGLREPFWALIELVGLWLAILSTQIVFWKFNRAAGILFIPYILWVSFAFYLNYSIWKLNL